MADADYDDLRWHRRRGALGCGRLQRRSSTPGRGGVTSVALVVGLGDLGLQAGGARCDRRAGGAALEGPMRIAPDDPGGEIADHQGLAVNDVAAGASPHRRRNSWCWRPRPVDLTPEDSAGPGRLAAAGLAEASAAVAAAAAGGRRPRRSGAPRRCRRIRGSAVDAGRWPKLWPPIAALTPSRGRGRARPGRRPCRAAGGRSRRLGPAPDARDRRAPRRRAAAAASTPRRRRSRRRPPRRHEVDPATIPAGTRLVQLGAFDTADEARAEWVRLRASSATDGGQGPGGAAGRKRRAHLLSACARTGFDDEADARRFCSALRGAKTRPASRSPQR